MIYTFDMEQIPKYDYARYFKDLGFDLKTPYGNLTNDQRMTLLYFKDILRNAPVSDSLPDSRIMPSGTTYAGSTYLATRTNHPYYFLELISKPFEEVFLLIDYIDYCWDVLANWRS